MKKRWGHLTKWIGKSLRLKIIAMTIVPIIIFQITVGAITLLAYNKVATKLVIERDRELAQLRAAQLTATLTSDIKRFDYMVDSLYSDSPNVSPPMEHNEEEENDNATLTILLDASGRVVTTRPEQTGLAGQDLSDRSYVVQALQSTQTTWFMYVKCEKQPKMR